MSGDKNKKIIPLIAAIVLGLWAVFAVSRNISGTVGNVEHGVEVVAVS